MTSNRSYREAMPQQVVREEIVKGAGGQFPYYESPDSQDDLALSFCFDLSFSGWKDRSRLRQVEAGGNSYQAFRSLFFFRLLDAFYAFAEFWNLIAGIRKLLLSVS